jgi:uncharacterized protein YndB with AHSA1/START domain
MLYDSTKTLLRTIVQSLEATDEDAWEDQIESAKECVFEMHQMNRALSMEFRTEGVIRDFRWPTRIVRSWIAPCHTSSP